MRIQWLGHSCFKLEESTGTTVVADPYDPKKVGIDLPKIKADVVTISHNHADHNYTDNIEDGYIKLNQAGLWEVNGVEIVSLQSYHDETDGDKRGENFIFKYRMDGVDLCHMGDIGEPSNPILGESIGSVNVLMIPVGGTYTINAEQAKEYVDFLMPDVVIPMHFKTPSSEIDVDKVDDFLDLFEEEQLIKVDGDTFEFDREFFDGESTKVIVFNENKF